MNIYLVERVEQLIGYDEYDSAIVVASTPKKAKDFVSKEYSSNTWWGKVACKKVGTTTLKKTQILLGSFNAG